MANKTISLSDLFVQGKGNIVSDMGGEKVMLSIHNGRYYNLGEIGGRIWELMERPISGGQMVAALMAEYNVEQCECEYQIVAFLCHLSNEGLIDFPENAAL